MVEKCWRGRCIWKSPLEAGPVRAKQVDEMFSLVTGADHAIVLGDFNFGDDESEVRRIHPNDVDLWRELQPNDPG